MFRLLFLSIFCLIIFQVNAQKNYDEIETILFSKGAKAVDRLDYVLRNEFSQLINTNSNGMIGDFFGISTKDKTLSLAYNFAQEKSTIEVSFSGGINDGIAGVFSDNKFKTGIQAGLKFNRLIGDKKVSLVYDNIKTIQKEYKALEGKYKADRLKDASIKDKFEKEIESKRVDSTAARDLVTELENNKKNNKPTFIQSSLNGAKNRLKKISDEINAIQFSLDLHDWGFWEKYNSNQGKCNEVLDKFKALRAKKFDLSWVSFGAGFLYESYNLFNPILKIDKQLFEENDFVPSFNLSYSHYSNNIKNKISSKVRRVKFYTVGGSIKYGNNFGSLSEVEIETTDSIAVNRSVIKTQKAFLGELEKNQVSAQVFFDYYELGFSKNNFGFHIRGTVDIEGYFPDVSLRGGILFSAINKDDNKSIANFEIFYGLNNMLQVGGEDSFLKRNILGIQTTFPIKLK